MANVLFEIRSTIMPRHDQKVSPHLHHECIYMIKHCRPHKAHTYLNMDTPIAQWLAWNICAYDAMNAIIRHATGKSPTTPSTINIEEISMLNCPTYIIFVKNGGPYHDSIYVPAFEEAMVPLKPLPAVLRVKRQLMRACRNASTWLLGPWSSGTADMSSISMLYYPSGLNASMQVVNPLCFFPFCAKAD